MAERALFGVAVPPGAVRVCIRPILGRGGAMPLYNERLEDDGIPSDSDIQAAASTNKTFWDYVDAQIKKKRIADSDADCEWKLRIQFFDQLGVEESFVTDGAYEFYRSSSASRGADDSPEARTFDRGLVLLERLTQSTEKAHRRIAESAASAIEGMVKAAADSIAKASEAGANAVAEASKQTAVVTEISRRLQDETEDLKKLIFGMHEKRAAEPAQPARSPAQDLKDVVDMGRTLMGMADTLMGPAPKSDAPTPSTPPAI